MIALAMLRLHDYNFKWAGKEGEVMPMFEYSCGKCGCDFEELVMGNEKVKCPACGAGRVKKKMSAFAHKSGGKFVSSSGGSGCGTCTKSSCSHCH
jgi:putative FmdB family regulatory protein